MYTLTYTYAYKYVYICVYVFVYTHIHIYICISHTLILKIDLSFEDERTAFQMRIFVHIRGSGLAAAGSSIILRVSQEVGRIFSQMSRLLH